MALEVIGQTHGKLRPPNLKLSIQCCPPNSLVSRNLSKQEKGTSYEPTYWINKALPINRSIIGRLRKMNIAQRGSNRQAPTVRWSTERLSGEEAICGV